MSRLSEAKGHRGRVDSAFPPPRSPRARSKLAGAYRELPVGGCRVQAVVNAAKKVGYFLLLFVIAITVGPVLRREFLPEGGLLPALGRWIGSMPGVGLFISGIIVAGVAFWCSRQPNSRD